MDEEIEYNPPELRPRRRLERPGRPEGEPEKTGFWGILTMQTILCVIAVIFLVVSQTFFPRVYEQSRQTYQKAAAAPAEVPKELAAFADKIVSFFTAPPTPKAPAGASSGEGSSAPASSDSQESSSGASSAGGSSQSTSGESQSAPSSSQPASSGDPASSKTSSAGVKNTAGIIRTSAGGVASSAPAFLPAQDTPLSPPANATFAPVLFTGKPGIPIKGAAQSSGFGYRISPITGKLEFHKALDLAAPRGTPVYAAASGKVAAAEYSPSLGYYIAIDHQNGFVTRYGHCSELVAPKGAVVRAGEVIAKVGATGEATGNHLHFEMSKDGVVFDPAWLYDYD